MNEAAATRVLVLIEDDTGEAETVQDLLADNPVETFEIVYVKRLSDAAASPQSRAVGVVLLDLRLPDSSGVETVKAVYKQTDQIPIVVLSGTEDEELAQACIDAGAQDYLSKGEVHARSLRRAIGDAISRVREAQLRELQETIVRYRALSSASQSTTVTAALAGSGAISMRQPEIFNRLVSDYRALFEGLVSERGGNPRGAMELTATVLGDTNGGPRDLLDVHVAALDQAIEKDNEQKSRSIVFEARLLALQIMGLLVDYYRVGHRRVFAKGFE